MKQEALGNEITCAYLIKSDDLAINLADFCSLSGNNQKKEQAAPAMSPPSPVRMDRAAFYAAHSA